MLRFPLVLVFVAMTFLSWGLYGPALHEGQHAMDRSLLRPLLCVGIAYFLVAVLVPLALLRRGGEAGGWTIGGVIWSVLAGVAGAVGALGIIVAFTARGNPLYVMPLVFGFAPVVNTFVTMAMSKTTREAAMVFYAGVLLVALGAAGVLLFKPQLPGGGRASPTNGAAHNAQAEAASRGNQPEPLLAKELLAILVAVAMTALCWGSYGPILHQGQAKMAGSRLRPFLCVGLAYFAVAVLVPLGILIGWREPGHWSVMGTVWSLAAGVFGALGALGIIMAFNFGGRPIYVMPLVFGGAPVVNTLTSITKSLIQYGDAGPLQWKFYLSLVLVIVGAVVVLVFSPKAGPAPSSSHAALRTAR